MSPIFLTLVAISMSTGTASAMPDTVTIARLEYDGGGDWYANPSSVPNLLEALRQRTELPVARREANVTAPRAP